MARSHALADSSFVMAGGLKLTFNASLAGITDSIVDILIVLFMISEIIQD